MIAAALTLMWILGALGVVAALARNTRSGGER